MLSVLICLIQITTVALITTAASMVCLKRSPQLSARFCWLGVVLSASVVLMTLAGAPRPWALRTTPKEELPRAPAQAYVTESAHVNPERPDESPSGVGFILTAQDILGHVNLLGRQHPRLEAGMVDGCLIICMLCCLSVLGRCLVSGWAVWRLRTGRPLPVTSSVHQELSGLAQLFDVAGVVRVCVSSMVSSPCVSWLSRRTIYVPDDFEHWTAEERRTAFAHELAHKVRQDPRSRAVAELCLSIVCFHPMMLWLRRQLIFAQELATDQHAARVLGNLSRYRRGLSLLALRMDSREAAGHLVSVSTHNVIRRIRMLNSSESLLNRWCELGAVGAFSVFCVLAAAWTAVADEPVRVATREVRPAAANDSSDVAVMMPPWEEFGEQDGYVVIQPRSMVKHPTLKQIYDAYDARIRQGIDLPAFGLTADRIARIQTPFALEIQSIPEEQRAQDASHRHTMRLNANAIVVHTTENIAWKSVGESIAATIPQLLGTDEQLELFQAAMARADQKSVLRLVSHEAEGRSVEHTQQIRAVWGHVSHCPLAMATAVPATIAPTIDVDGFVNSQELLSVVNAFACGIDHDPNSGRLQLRVALAPADEHEPASVLALAEQSLKEVIADGRAKLPEFDPITEDDSELIVIDQLLDDLSAATFEVVTAEDGRQIITGEIWITADLSVLTF